MSTHARLALRMLSDDQMELIHRASLRILSKTGVNVHSKRMQSLMVKAGCRLREEVRVSIPPELVDRALASAPSRIDIYDRNGTRAMQLEGTRSYYGPGSDLEFTLDSRTGQRRESTLQDVARTARLCDKLENIDFVMSYALPTEVTRTRCEIEQLRVMLEHTKKPIIMTIFSGLDAFEEMHNLACKSCGGEDRFRSAPNYIMYGQFISPLQHITDALDRLIFCAEHGVPLIYVPTIMTGASGPATLAGALALANAECLAGLVMHQLCVPGAPFIYGGCVSPLDMKTTVFAYGTPEWRLADVALSELSQRYKLPIFGTAGATDAKTIDAQAGAEWAYSLLTATLTGTNLIHDVGYAESGLTGSLEALAICDDIIGMVKRMSAGFEIDADTLAEAVVDRVGPAGHYMQDEHTLDNFLTDTWYPSLLERGRFDSWKAAGGKDMVSRAADRVHELLGD